MWISKHKLKSVDVTLKNSLNVDSILISLQFWILVKLRTKNKVLKQFELSDRCSVNNSQRWRNGFRLQDSKKVLVHEKVLLIVP